MTKTLDNRVDHRMLDLGKLFDNDQDEQLARRRFTRSIALKISTEHWNYPRILTTKTNEFPKPLT
jgi:hypothetical protein